MANELSDRQQLKIMGALFAGQILFDGIVWCGVVSEPPTDPDSPLEPKALVDITQMVRPDGNRPQRPYVATVGTRNGITDAAPNHDFGGPNERVNAKRPQFIWSFRGKTYAL